MQFKVPFKIVLSLVFFLMLTNILSAQKKVTQYYITQDGVKTPIVFDPFSVDNEKSKFLYEKGEKNEYSSRYDKLKDASEATDDVFRKMDTIRKMSTSSDGAFSLTTAKRNMEMLQKDNNSNRGNSAASLEELLFLKQKYGDSPSFFVNDIEVSKEVFNKVADKDIINREVLVQNTVSGNPNGEIRILVPDKVAKKIGLSSDSQYNPTVNIESYAFTQPLKETNLEKEKQVSGDLRSVATDGASLDKLLKEIMEIDSASSTETVVKSKAPDVPKEKYVKSAKVSQQTQSIPVKKEIVYSYDDMYKKPQKVVKEQTKEEDVFVVRSSDWKRVEPKVETKSENKEEKRSVRDIKDRQRNQ